MAKPDREPKAVLITRPAERSQVLTDLIAGRGGRPILFPTISIQPAAWTAELRALFASLPDFDLAIFISCSAVEHGLNMLAAQGAWPDGLPVAAVGAATARCLEERGIEPALVPDGNFSSEGLLALSALQHLTEKNIIIFRGVGGREKLARELTVRGARVAYAECYRRVLPDVDTSKLRKVLQAGGVSDVVVTSNEGLQNLFNLLEEERHLLVELHYVVLSERTADLARKLGIKQPVSVAVPASDEGIFRALGYAHN